MWGFWRHQAASPIAGGTTTSSGNGVMNGGGAYGSGGGGDSQEPEGSCGPTPCLDAGAFAAFSPLLTSCEDYARLSGCRFRSSSFDGLGVDRRRERCDSSVGGGRGSGDGGGGGSAASDGGGSGGGAGRGGGAKARPPPSSDGVSRLATFAALMASQQDYSRLVAKLRAEPQVRHFMERLRAPEPEAELAEELEAAMRIAGAESVRKSMVATCRNLELWPPMPPPPGVEEDDCHYEEAGASVPVVAQRLFNDEARRKREATSGASNRRAATAAFLISFAVEAGVPLPPLPEECSARIVEFALRAADWEAAAAALAADRAAPPMVTEEVISDGAGAAVAANGKDDAASGAVVADCRGANGTLASLLGGGPCWTRSKLTT